jgi:hypothetical protein
VIWAGYASETITARKVLVGKLKGRRHVQNLGIDGGKF